MKKAALFVFGLVLATAASAHAQLQTEARLSKSYAFPVATLEKVEAAMQAAAQRTGADMKKEVSYVIDANDKSTVRCLDHSPMMYQGALYGCVLEFEIDLGQGVIATAGHMLYITQSSKEVNDLLAKTDPNQTARVDLKTIFDGGQGSQFYCNAEGAAGAKAWACYLNLVD